MFAGGNGRAVRAARCERHQQVLARTDRAAQRLTVRPPAVARRGGVLERPAADVNGGRAAIEQFHVVVGVSGSGIPAAPIQLADHDRTVARLRRGRADVRGAWSGDRLKVGRRVAGAARSIGTPLVRLFGAVAASVLVDLRLAIVQQREQHGLVGIVGVVDEGVAEVRRRERSIRSENPTRARRRAPPRRRRSAARLPRRRSRRPRPRRLRA